MADSERLWTVESGEYSSHVVMCACRTEAEAKAVAKAYNASDDAWREARVGQLLLVSEPVQVVTLMAQVDIFDDGTTVGRMESVRTEFEFDMTWPHYATPVGWRWVRAPVHQGKGGRLEVYGTDHERVRKVFSDTRARLLADDVFRSRKETKG